MATLRSPFKKSPISHVSSRPLSWDGSLVFLLKYCTSSSVSWNTEILFHHGREKNWPLSSLGQFRGDPRSWLESPLSPIARSCGSVQKGLFCISLVFHIPVFAQLCCLLLKLVHCELCANVLQRTVLNSNYTCIQPAHKQTETHTEWR